MRMCTADIVHCTIDFAGDVRPCSLSSESYGKVQDFEKIWQSFKNLSCERSAPPQCSGCVYENTCKGGCNNCKRDISLSCDYSLKPIKTLITFPAPSNKVPASALLVFNPNIIFRAEDFGAILYAGIKYWIAADHELVTFFNQYQNSTFSVSDLKNHFEMDEEDVTRLVNYLLKRRIVMIH